MKVRFSKGSDPDEDGDLGSWQSCVLAEDIKEKPKETFGIHGDGDLGVRWRSGSDRGVPSRSGA